MADRYSHLSRGPHPRSFPRAHALAPPIPHPHVPLAGRIDPDSRDTGVRVTWGPEPIQLYNNAYRPSLGAGGRAKHTHKAA